MSCQEGGTPGGLPLKGYSAFKPLRSVATGEENLVVVNPSTGKEEVKKKITLYQHQFQAEGDITAWQLKKSCHWQSPAYGAGSLAVLGLVGSLGIGGAVAAGIGVPSAEPINLPGTFEYKIIDPGGNIIFWSRVNLCLTGMVLVNAAIGPGMFGTFTAWLGTDRSVDWRSRRKNTPPIDSTIAKPQPPVLVPTTDIEGKPVGGVFIYHHGMPTGAGRLMVQRAEESDNSSGELVFTNLGNQEMTLVPDSGISGGLYSKVDLTASRGKVYYYRIVAEGDGEPNIGDAISTLIYNKQSCRTIIETFVIDGKPTVNHPDRKYSGNERLTYDEYVDDYIVYPKNREETFLLCPPEILGVTNQTMILDFDWYGPMYKMKIPNGSILRVVMDGTSFGTFSQKGKTAAWQFSAKTESILWGVITDVAGRMISTSPEGTGMALINAENVNEGGTIHTNRTKIIFAQGSSAFVLKSITGGTYVFVNEDRKTKIYFSSNGSVFESIKTTTGEDYEIFLEAHNILDLTQDKDGVIYLLSQFGNDLYVTRNIDNYIQNYFVSNKPSGNCVFELGGAAFSADAISIVCSDFRFLSSDKGLTWRLQGIS